MKAAVRSALNFAGSLYYRLRATGPVWRFINRDGRRAFRDEGSILTLQESRILADLKRDGIAMARMEELFPAQTFAALSEYAIKRWRSPEVQREVLFHQEILSGERSKAGVKKAFLVNLWPSGDSPDAALPGKPGLPMLDRDNPFIRFSLSGPVLRVANAYLEQFSRFRAWRLEATIPMPGGVRPQASQRWHRDEEDIKLVKVFVYLNDVDRDAGPFMYVKDSHFGGPERNIFPVSPPRGSLAMPENEGRYIPERNITTMAGRAGTVLFCDTSGLHKGGFAVLGERLMYTSVYTSSATLWPIRYRYPTSFRIPPDLAPAQRFALDNDPSQSEPTFYR